MIVAIDDTLFKRTGKKVHAIGLFHEGSAKGPHKIGLGNNWVIAAIVVTLPICSRPVALPVLWRSRCPSGRACRFGLPQRRSDSHYVPIGVGQPCLVHPPRAIFGDRPGGDHVIDILDVEIHMSDRAAVEAVLRQVQLRGAAS